MNRVDTGKNREKQAALFLEKQGFQVLQRNFRCRQGEVDIIGIHENCLVFVEVKYRSSSKAGMPEEAVGVQKQRKICQASDYFRLKHREYQTLQIRYDVVAMLSDRIRWYKNAFFYRADNNYIKW